MWCGAWRPRIFDVQHPAKLIKYNCIIKGHLVRRRRRWRRRRARACINIYGLGSVFWTGGHFQPSTLLSAVVYFIGTSFFSIYSYRIFFSLVHAIFYYCNKNIIGICVSSVSSHDLLYYMEKKRNATCNYILMNCHCQAYLGYFQGRSYWIWK